MQQCPCKSLSLTDAGIAYVYLLALKQIVSSMTNRVPHLMLRLSCRPNYFRIAHKGGEGQNLSVRGEQCEGLLQLPDRVAVRPVRALERSLQVAGIHQERVPENDPSSRGNVD